ncbi:unnamed protein product [Linum tenue]|uniref:Probable purine permease n=1 Tax=Linum tenue TaxID=586396 RepID=A0AAV0NEC4_9ROSI|nr:unnamed protein product [Linum tenue]
MDQMEPSATTHKIPHNHNHNHNKTFLILLNCLLLAVGQVGGPILSRMYFLHGGTRKWLAAWSVNSGFPILLLPIAISHYTNTTTRRRNNPFVLTTWLFCSSAVVGILFGATNYFYSFGASYLPVSVNSLVSSSQLAFTALFAYLIVKQNFTHYSINAVVLMTFGSVILGAHMDGDIPEGETKTKYVLGFVMTIAAAAFHGFSITALEFAQRKSGVAVTFDVAMHVQFVVSLFATIFCTVPMVVNRDFEALSGEAAEFGLGETNSSSLFTGLVTSLLVPVQQVFAVIFLREGFNAEKALALALCLWGFASHLYGGYKASLKKKKKNDDVEDYGDDEQGAKSSGDHA